MAAALSTSTIPAADVSNVETTALRKMTMTLMTTVAAAVAAIR
jgi:hypothetical protein